MTCADPIVAFGIGDTADEADGARVLVVYNDAVANGGQHTNRHCSSLVFGVCGAGHHGGGHAFFLA